MCTGFVFSVTKLLLLGFVFSKLSAWQVIYPENNQDLKQKLQFVVQYINETQKDLIRRSLLNFIVSNPLPYFISFYNSIELASISYIKVVTY